LPESIRGADGDEGDAYGRIRPPDAHTFATAWLASAAWASAATENLRLNI
jgi:hypothetical protein